MGIEGGGGVILYGGVRWMSDTYTNEYMNGHGRGKDR